MTDPERHYRIPLAARIAIRFSYVVVLAFAVLGVGERAAPVFLGIVVVAAAWCVLIGEIVIRTGGLYETSAGITNRRLFGIGYRRQAWGEIERFRTVRTRVFVVLRNGAVWPLVGVAQGARTVWDDGETRDIVAVLNERLGYWRSVVVTGHHVARDAE